jgi:hypothetical protein
MLSFYEGDGDLKTGDSESEVLCTDSTALDILLWTEQFWEMYGML